MEPGKFNRTCFYAAFRQFFVPSVVFHDTEGASIEWNDSCVEGHRGYFLVIHNFFDACPVLR